MVCQSVLCRRMASVQNSAEFASALASESKKIVDLYETTTISSEARFSATTSFHSGTVVKCNIHCEIFKCKPYPVVILNEEG
jgi:hypothetical protein